MQTITQIPTKTYILLFGPFTMFFELCMQIHYVGKLTSKKYAKTINLLCAGNKIL